MNRSPLFYIVLTCWITLMILGLPMALWGLYNLITGHVTDALLLLAPLLVGAALYALLKRLKKTL